MRLSPLLVQLEHESRKYATPDVAGSLPCEDRNSHRWHCLARRQPFDLLARAEWDNTDEETGADQIGLRVKLQSGTDAIVESSLWGIITPDPAEDWTAFNEHLSEILQELVTEVCDTEGVQRMLRERVTQAELLLRATT